MGDGDVTFVPAPRMCHMRPRRRRRFMSAATYELPEAVFHVSEDPMREVLSHQALALALELGLGHRSLSLTSHKPPVVVLSWLLVLCANRSSAQKKPYFPVLPSSPHRHDDDARETSKGTTTHTRRN